MTISKDFSLESPNLEISFENSKEKIAQEFYDLSEMIISDLLNNNQTEKSIVLKEKIFENQYQGYKGFLVHWNCCVINYAKWYFRSSVYFD